MRTGSGWCPQRPSAGARVISGAGPIPVSQPRVRHRDKGRFSSAILPKYMRRVPSVDAFVDAGEPLVATTKSKRNQALVKICEEIKKAVKKSDESPVPIAGAISSPDQWRTGPVISSTSRVHGRGDLRLHGLSGYSVTVLRGFEIGCKGARVSASF